MRQLTMCEATNNFAIFCEHVSEYTNCKADTLSCFQIDRFKQLAPAAEEKLQPLPCTR